MSYILLRLFIVDLAESVGNHSEKKESAMLVPIFSLKIWLQIIES